MVQLLAPKGTSNSQIKLPVAALNVPMVLAVGPHPDAVLNVNVPTVGTIPHGTQDTVAAKPGYDTEASVRNWKVSDPLEEVIPVAPPGMVEPHHRSEEHTSELQSR